MRHYALASCLVLGCDYVELSTEAGEHVVYHWDSSQNQLCGGTVAAADRFVEAIPAHYGLPFETAGPNVEYFWDLRGMSSPCDWTADRNACMIRLLSGSVVIAPDSLHTHELAHTTAGGHGRPAFLNEGFAIRWESEILRGVPVSRTLPNFPSGAELRAELAKTSADVDYLLAYTWWAALEVNHGPAKVGEFIAELEPSASAEDIEPALQRVFGISLAESAELAEDLPEVFLDDPACALAGLPTWVWDGQPIIIERGQARCEDDDVSNLSDTRASWLFTLEFPDEWVAVNLKVTVADDVDPQGKTLVLGRCDGKISVDDDMAYYYSATPEHAEGAMLSLSGRYVVALRTRLEADGSMEFPRVVFEEPSP